MAVYRKTIVYIFKYIDMSRMSRLDFHALINRRAGSFQRKPIFIAEWMIATECGCCLRPLGIVMDEQLCSAAFIKHPIPALQTILCFHYDRCSFITMHYGRVHAVSVVIIHAVGRL